MPLLTELSKILLNICSSSSHTEGFFSIIGFVYDQKRLNMKEDLIVTRSLLKTNLHLLEE